MRDPRRGPILRWAGVIVITVAVSLGLALAGVPSPVLFGGLVGGIGYALTAETPLEVPARVFKTGQALIGTTIGALVSLPTLARIGDGWVSVLAITLGTMVISILAGQLLALRKDVSPTTGAFALVAGGASGIVALARELGADDRVVTVVQYLRVLIVLLTLPLALTWVFDPATGVGALPDPQTRWLPDLTFTLVSVVVGMLVARYLPIPAGALLGPLLVAVALAVTDVLGEVSVPPLLENLGYALIGVQVGLRFTRASLRSVARILPVTVLLIVAVIAACAGMGMLLAATTGIDGLTAYLATTPGGLFAVLAAAADSGSDVTYVLAVQVIRIFVTVLTAPLLAKVLSRGRTRSPRDPA